VYNKFIVRNHARDRGDTVQTEPKVQKLSGKRTGSWWYSGKKLL